MNNRTLWLAGVAAFVGCAIGYFAADDSAQKEKLRRRDQQQNQPLRP